jgi:type II secretory pathway component PulK
MIRSGYGKSRNAKGSALIIVLWVVGLLSILVGSFAFDAHIEARITSYYRKRTKAEYLAKSGIEIAEMLMVKSGDVKKTQLTTEETKEDRWYAPAKLLSEGLAITGSSLVEKLGDGTVTVEIVPEPARRNINNLGKTDQEKEENLERILEVANVPQDLFPTLIESFLDWTDADDIQRADGAENDYYEMLETPYKVKNGPLDTTGELLLVKGFSRAILYGGKIETGRAGDEPVSSTGIDDLLTTYGDGKINVNAASKRVLMTLPDVTDQIADTIIEEREGWTEDGGRKEDTSFKGPDDFLSRIPEVNPSIKDYVTTESGIYRITSVGNVGGVRFEIWSIVQRTEGGITILRWREEN